MFKMENLKVTNLINEHMRVMESLYGSMGNIEEISRKIYGRLSTEKQILIMGNGGSAADAQHMAAELVGRFKEERKGLDARALTTDTSILTAWANDYDYSTIFERQVEAHAKSLDVLFGLSTSGNSENIIKAFQKGKEIGTMNISLTGKDGGEIKKLSDYNINVVSENTPRIQEAHLFIYHTICELVEKMYVNGGNL